MPYCSRLLGQRTSDFAGEVCVYSHHFHRFRAFFALEANLLGLYRCLPPVHVLCSKVGNYTLSGLPVVVAPPFPCSNLRVEIDDVFLGFIPSLITVVEAGDAMIIWTVCDPIC